MSLHIGANSGEIAKTVLLPGDPLRAKWIAENFLTNVRQFNSVRNMLGFTGTAPDGRLVSVMGSGMGMPSLGIYAHELIVDYDVKRIVRLGTSGSLQEEIKLRDVIFAYRSCVDLATDLRRAAKIKVVYSPYTSVKLLRRAEQVAKELRVPVRTGTVLATDRFYHYDRKVREKLSRDGVLAVDMETAELYAEAVFHKAEALSILAISDIVPINGRVWEGISAEEKENSLSNITNIALKL